MNNRSLNKSLFKGGVPVKYHESMIAFKERIQNLKDNGELHLARRHRKKRRQYLIQRGRCCFCNRLTYLDFARSTHKNTRMATWEHIVPASLGGTNYKKNLIISCSGCNRDRGIIPFDEFKRIRQLPNYLTEIHKYDGHGAKKLDRDFKKAEKRRTGHTYRIWNDCNVILDGHGKFMLHDNPKWLVKSDQWHADQLAFALRLFYKYQKS